MPKTRANMLTIQLPPKLKRAARLAAAKADISVSELARRALVAYLKGRK